MSGVATIGNISLYDHERNVFSSYTKDLTNVLFLIGLISQKSNDEGNKNTMSAVPSLINVLCLLKNAGVKNNVSAKDSITIIFFTVVK